MKLRISYEMNGESVTKIATVEEIPDHLWGVCWKWCVRLLWLFLLWGGGLISFSEGIQELYEGVSEGNYFSSFWMECGGMGVISVLFRWYSFYSFGCFGRERVRMRGTRMVKGRVWRFLLCVECKNGFLYWKESWDRFQRIKSGFRGKRTEVPERSIEMKVSCVRGWKGMRIPSFEIGEVWRGNG